MVGHLDLDYFYAQVEEIEDPSLRTLPVVVCVFSGRTEESGVVSTANYEARKFGAKSGIPIGMAKKRLEGKDARFIPIDREKYQTYSDRVMHVVEENVDVIEQTGIDEAFFDVTKRSQGDYATGTSIASKMKQKIFENERLTCSVGVAPNKVAAKLASDFRKPDGLTVVPPSNLTQFMAPMPVERLYGIGPKTAKTLNEIGVLTIGDLARKSLDDLEDALDKKLSIYLHNAANGIDEQPVVDNGEAKQLSRIITLKHDIRDVDEIIVQLSIPVEQLHRSLMTKGLFFRSVSVIGILPDLSSRTRTRTLDAPSQDLPSLRRTITELFSALLSETGELRRAGVRLSTFSEARSQSSLAEFIR